MRHPGDILVPLAPSTRSGRTCVRGLVPRTLVVVGVVAFTAACSGGGEPPPARGRAVASSDANGEATDPTVFPSPTTARSANSRPSTGSVGESGSLLSPPVVGAGSSTPVPTLVLATGNGERTGVPEPPPDTVSLEDLYRQGQVDVSR